MNKVFMPLANMDFATMLNEAHSNTTSGEQLLNNYRRVLLTNESTCGLVNRFVKEAQQYRYDNGVNQVLEDVCEIIDKNKISWQLATACESVNNNASSFNYLNRNAARQVEDLLEGKIHQSRCFKEYNVL
jgi:predicted helicase